MKAAGLTLFGLMLGLLFFGQTYAYASSTAYATTRVNMRTGPGTQYPVLLQVPRAGVTVVHRCLRSRWCDASFRGVRGWIYGKYLRQGALPPRYIAPVPAPPNYTLRFEFGPPVYYRPYRPRYHYRPYRRYYRHW
ncbi:SH3 domain-containing protein [Pseudovibrio exalbescens]|uniref:SH3 domain-containing protein n=1 Tax=Pseudovibrio exalbescens TaxID=197461 RepID=UPI00093B0AF9|nr:SH3 domain-containing protein [Pseudovibrio exalbescens]